MFMLLPWKLKWIPHVIVINVKAVLRHFSRPKWELFDGCVMLNKLKYVPV